MSSLRYASAGTSVVIVNYNGAHYLRAALRAIRHAGSDFAEVILADNGSDDDSVRVAREELPAVRLLRLDRNYGSATARNAGFKAATRNRVLFLDCDVQLTAGCAEKLNAALDDEPQAVAAMPAVVYEHNLSLVQYSGADSHFLGLLSKRDADVRVDTLRGRNPASLGTIITCCFLLDRERWGDRPPFDDSFFTLFEDFEFGLRSRVLGHKVLSVPSATIYHGQGTEGLSIRRTGRYTPLRVYLLVRNRWQVVLKNYQARTLVLLLPALLLYEIFQLALMLKKGWWREWLRALGWLVRYRAALVRKRREVQAARRTPDREILSSGPLPFTGYLTTGRLERAGKQVLDAATNSYWRAVRGLL